MRQEPGAPEGNRNALKGKTTFDNAQSCFEPERSAGTSRRAGLRRLEKHRPDLYEAYLGGRVSVNAAMVEAGFRPRTVTVPLDPVRAARTEDSHHASPAQGPQRTREDALSGGAALRGE